MTFLPALSLTHMVFLMVNRRNGDAVNTLKHQQEIQGCAPGNRLAVSVKQNLAPPPPQIMCEVEGDQSG